MKDNFSRQSGAYAKFRPVYPPELFYFIFGTVNHFARAWDCGTGNGQVAQVLATRFREVEATDISGSQLEKAIPKPNIHYSRQPAETADFPQDHFDLITVGQAVHWFDHEPYYHKVKSVLKPEGVLAEFGYQLFRSSPAINVIIDGFYHEIIAPFWDVERKHIDEAYARIPFPFESIPTPEFQMSYVWSLEQLIGYLSTWSSVQHYIEEKKEDPVSLIEEELAAAWGEEQEKEIHFRILLRMGNL